MEKSLLQSCACLKRSSLGNKVRVPKYIFIRIYMGYLREPSVRESKLRSKRRILTQFKVSRLFETLLLNFELGERLWLSCSRLLIFWLRDLLYSYDWKDIVDSWVVWGVLRSWPHVVRSRNGFICASDVDVNLLLAKMMTIQMSQMDYAVLSRCLLVLFWCRQMEVEELQMCW
jgi:hypothetical protein